MRVRWVSARGKDHEQRMGSTRPSLARTASNGRAGVQRIRPADTSGEREGTWSRRGEDQGEFWINDPSRVFVVRAVSMRCPPRSSVPLGIAARSRQTTGNKRRSFVGHAAVTFRVSAMDTARVRD